MKDGSIYIIQNLDCLKSSSNEDKPNFKRQKTSNNVNIIEINTIKSSLPCLDINPPLSIPIKPIIQFNHFTQIKYLNPFFLVIYHDKIEFYGNITTKCDYLIYIENVNEIEKYNEIEYLIVDKFGCIFKYNINTSNLIEIISFNTVIKCILKVNRNDYIIHFDSKMCILNENIILKEFEVDNIYNIQCYNDNYIFYISNNTLYICIIIIYSSFYLSTDFPSHFVPISISLPNISFFYLLLLYIYFFL